MTLADGGKAEGMEADGTTRTGIARLMPILAWAPRYRRAWLRPDVVAGVTVAALVVPKALGWPASPRSPSSTASTRPRPAPIIYALFCTSRQIATGPSAALSSVAAGAVLATAASGDQAVTMVASITFVSGLFFLLLAVFKMGWISQFLSRAVIVGFLFGAGIQTTIGELAKITGTEATGDNSWRKLASWLGSMGDTHASTVVVGVLALVVIFGLHWVAPRVPGALVLVVGGLLATALFGLEDRGWRWWGTCRAACRRSCCPTSSTSARTSSTSSRRLSRSS